MAKTYNDYPVSATNNAKKALAWKEKYGDEVKGGTIVGWTRARQLANREALSYSTIARMAAFARHRSNSTVDPKFAKTPWKDRGYVAWLIWGGTSGVNWAIKKAEAIRNEKKFSVHQREEDKDMIDGIIDLLLRIDDLENRKEIALIQIQDLKNQNIPFDEEAFLKAVRVWSQEMAKQNPDGSVSPSKKAPKSTTPEKNPKGVGEGGKLSPEIIASIQKKVDAYNEQYPEKRISISAAKTVVLRGMGAFNTSNSPKVTSSVQWGLARLNAFLYLLKNGSPQNPKYVTDNDLLPSWHKKSNK